MGLNAAVGHHSEVDGIAFHGAFVVVLVFVSFVVARNARHALRHETDSVACDLTVPYGQTVPLTSSEKSGGSRYFLAVNLEIKPVVVGISPIVFHGSLPFTSDVCSRRRCTSLVPLSQQPENTRYHRETNEQRR